MLLRLMMKEDFCRGGMGFDFSYMNYSVSSISFCFLAMCCLWLNSTSGWFMYFSMNSFR